MSHPVWMKAASLGVALLGLGLRPAAAADSLTAEQSAKAKALVAGKCTTCHSAAKAARKDPAQMQDHIRKKGELTDPEVQLVTAYLAAQRGESNLTAAATNSAASAAAQRRARKRKHHFEDDD